MDLGQLRVGPRRNRQVRLGLVGCRHVEKLAIEVVVRDHYGQQGVARQPVNLKAAIAIGLCRRPQLRGLQVQRPRGCEIVAKFLTQGIHARHTDFCRP